METFGESRFGEHKYSSWSCFRHAVYQQDNYGYIPTGRHIQTYHYHIIFYVTDSYEYPDHSYEYSDNNCLMTTVCEEMAPTMTDNQVTQQAHWSENKSEQTTKQEKTLLVKTKVPDKPPEKMVV